ncbi:MAG: rRNA pseudouridine synthase [Nitrospirae bacterium]|nr:rRNA pseudouridine synthase [Nitrospirota bacterium]
MLERLQKIISRAGVASRRKAEELMTAGAVTVNGRVVHELGSKADSERDHIKVSGKLINPKQPKAYLMLNKPREVVTTLSDPMGRVTVKELLRGVRIRVYPVGRLDYDSEGLLLLTNDGELVQKMLHPSFEVPKTYEIKVRGVLTDEEIRTLSKGVELSDGRTLPCQVRKIEKTEKNSWLEMTIHEGRNRQIRRMLETMDHPVTKLKRIRVGKLELGALPVGRYRYLTSQEIKSLKQYITAPRRARPAPKMSRAVGT